MNYSIQEYNLIADLLRFARDEADYFTHGCLIEGDDEDQPKLDALEAQRPVFDRMVALLGVDSEEAEICLALGLDEQQTTLVKDLIRWAAIQDYFDLDRFDEGVEQMDLNAQRPIFLGLADRLGLQDVEI